MVHRELTEREKEILLMIRPITVQDMVEDVRDYYDFMRYTRKHIMTLPA